MINPNRQRQTRVQRSVVGYAIAMVSIVALVGIKAALLKSLPDAEFRVLDVLVTGLVAYVYGLGPGLLALALSVFGYFYLYIPPIFSLNVIGATAADWAEFAILIFGDAVAVAAMNNLREARRRVAERANLLEAEIEERKHAEYDVQRSRTLLAEAEKLSHTGAWEWDLASNRWTFSDEWLAIHGCEKKVLSPEELLEISYPDDREKVARAFDDARRGVSSYDIEHRIIRQDDGEVRFVRARGRYIKDSDGTVVRVYGFAQDITEQKKAEEALRENEAQLRTVLENINEGVVVSDLNGEMIFWNRVAVRMHGYSRMEEVKKKLPEFDSVLELSDMNGKYIPIDQWPLARVMRGESLHGWEVRLKRPDVGLDRIFSYGGDIVRDADGNPMLALLTISDITERRQAEGALRESEEQFRTMVSAMPQLAWMADADGYIFWYNQRWYDYTGTTPEQMEGWGWQSVHDPEMLPKVLERWKASIATREPFEMEFPLRGADGKFRWFLTRVLPLKDAEGNVTRWFGTNTDVSERRETEEALREQARMLDYVHVLVRDMDSKVMFWNKGAEMLYGYTREYAVGKPIHELLKTRSSMPLEEIMSELFKSGEWEGELIHRNKDGSELAIASHWVLHRDSDGNPVAIIETNNDITELKQVEEQLRKLNSELEGRVEERTAELRASNTELEAAVKELEAFSYSVSHDLRTPLRAIGGFSDALLKYYSDSLDTRGQDYLRRVGAAAQRMSQLIDDILGLSRATRVELHRQQVDMSALAWEVLDELRKSQPERKSEIVIEPDMIVNADSHLLHIILANLLGNAWKFTSNREVCRIEVGTLKQNGKRVYFIKDNGAGFNPAYADKLFAPFQRLHTESDFPGTGIGLALVLRILRRHGGSVWAVGEVDKGATFYFTLGEADK